jgi:GNAT superfamily N-acetyltransferase
MSLLENRVIGKRVCDAERPTDAAMAAADIRCLGPQDEGELCRILLGLEPSGRCGRFGQAANDAYLSGYAKFALANADWIVGAFIDERLRGVVEVYNSGPHGYAEAAFVVEQEWRRRGLGWALLRAAMQIAAQSEADRLRMIFSRHNWPMRKLADKAGGTLDIVLDELSVDVALAEIGSQARAGRGNDQIGIRLWHDFCDG